MSQPQTVTVDQQEILNRADEVEAPMATPPTDVPQAPSGLTAANNAAEQLAISADNVRLYLQAGERERQRLATSLRNAAAAYGEVEDESATALDNDGNGEVDAQSAGGAGAGQTDSLEETPKVAAAGESDFTDLKTAATKLESGDQGTSMVNFADGWNNFNLALQRDIKRFRIFENWEGDAATACEASLDQQKDWILHMAKLSASLAKQANFMAQLQLWARRGHPTLADIIELERLAKDPDYQEQAIKLYAEYQETSEKVLSEYNTKADLEPVNPPKPPEAIKIDPPPPAQPQGLIPGFLMPPSDGSTGLASGMTPPMIPPTGGAGGTPDVNTAELTSAGREAASNLSKGLGVKPMSLGGGGGGLGGVSMGDAPLAGGESVRPAAAGDVAGAGQGAGAAGRGMAGGGMGMPMGGAGQGQGGAKSKGAQQDEEALYTEDREWTEAVIGNRRRQDNK